MAFIDGHIGFYCMSNLIQGFVRVVFLRSLVLLMSRSFTWKLTFWDGGMFGDIIDLRKRIN